MKAALSSPVLYDEYEDAEVEAGAAGRTEPLDADAWLSFLVGVRSRSPSRLEAGLRES